MPPAVKYVNASESDAAVWGPRWSAPDDHEGKEPPLRARIGTALGPLEGQEDAPADPGRVVQLWPGSRTIGDDDEPLRHFEEDM